MADYCPIFQTRDPIPMTVGATAVVAGNLVFTGATAKTVIPTTGSVLWLGVAIMDGATGARVGVVSGGIQELVASAAIALGAAVVPAAAGKVATIGAEAVYPRVVGVALTAAAADGDKIWVWMVR